MIVSVQIPWQHLLPSARRTFVTKSVELFPPQCNFCSISSLWIRAVGDAQRGQEEYGIFISEVKLAMHKPHYFSERVKDLRHAHTPKYFCISAKTITQKLYTKR